MGIAVSVICMTYNQVNYIDRCLQSLLSQQTNFPYEVIVHDDESNDGTTEIVKRYADNYPEVVVPMFESRNRYQRGLSVKEVMLPKVRGKYVAICEGDDWWIDSNKLQKQYDYMEKHPEVSVTTHAIRVYDDRSGKWIKVNSASSVPRDYNTDEIVELRAPFGTNSLFLRSQYWDSPKEYKRWGVGDYPLCIWLSTCGVFHYEPEIMSAYRAHAGNSWSERMNNSNDYAIRQYEKIIAGLERFKEASGKNHARAVNAAIEDYKIDICVLSHDYESLKHGKLAQRFRTRSARQRLIAWMKCKHPSTASFMKNKLHLHG